MSERRARELAKHEADGGSGGSMIARRELLMRFGRLVVIFPALAMAARCGGGGSGDGGGDPANGFTIASSTALGHSHDLFVPFEVVEQPAASARSLTSSAASTYTLGGHTHTVVLSVDDLTRIMHGETVTVTSSSTSGHMHAFAIRLP